MNKRVCFRNDASGTSVLTKDIIGASCWQIVTAIETEFHLKISQGPPFWWEIYRADDPQWVERSMFGYLMENEARLDGEAALHRLINREIARDKAS